MGWKDVGEEDDSDNELMYLSKDCKFFRTSETFGAWTLYR